MPTRTVARMNQLITGAAAAPEERKTMEAQGFAPLTLDEASCRKVRTVNETHGN